MFIQVTERKGQRKALNTRYMIGVDELDPKDARHFGGQTLIEMVENDEEVMSAVIVLESYDEAVNMIVGMRRVTN